MRTTAPPLAAAPPPVLRARIAGWLRAKGGRVEFPAPLVAASPDLARALADPRTRTDFQRVLGYLGYGAREDCGGRVAFTRGAVAGRAGSLGRFLRGCGSGG